MGYLADLEIPSPLPPAVRRGRTHPRIELDTPIVPQAVAEAVWEEAGVWLGEPLPRRWIAELTARANTVYGGNRRFRRLLRRRGHAGRDWLWAFTRHWLAALIWKHRPDLHARLPAAYNVGKSLPQTHRLTGQSMTSMT